MRILIDIPEWIYRRIQDIGLSGYPIITDTANAIRRGTPIPDNATNGDCVRKLFCKGIYRTSVRTNVSVEFKRDWWNAPYQKEAESDE